MNQQANNLPAAATRRANAPAALNLRQMQQAQAEQQPTTTPNSKSNMKNASDQQIEHNKDAIDVSAKIQISAIGADPARIASNVSHGNDSAPNGGQKRRLLRAPNVLLNGITNKPQSQQPADEKLSVSEKANNGETSIIFTRNRVNSDMTTLTSSTLLGDELQGFGAPLSVNNTAATSGVFSSINE